jgi:hypothetical protein
MHAPGKHADSLVSCTPRSTWAWLNGAGRSLQLGSVAAPQAPYSGFLDENQQPPTAGVNA